VTTEAGGSLWGRAEHSPAQAIEDAIHKADEQGLLPAGQDFWQVDLFVQTEHHSPSHVQWFYAKVTPTSDRPAK
jgi:hypothetical protein